MTLTERSPWLGGRLCQSNRVFQSEAWPSVCDSSCVGPVQAKGVVLGEQIQALTQTRIVCVERSNGCFKVSLRGDPEFVNPKSACMHTSAKHTLAYHWARLVECLYCAEEVLRLALDPQITDREVRVIPTNKPSSGVGVVEAARGTLYHHYETDTRGTVKSVNLIVATVQNNAAMNMSVKKAVTKLIRGGQVSDELLE